MNDPNICLWQTLDWEQELQSILTAMRASRRKKERQTYQASVGRCLLLMQEYLDAQDWEYILVRCGMNHFMQHVYLNIYRLTLRYHMEQGGNA